MSNFKNVILVEDNQMVHNLFDLAIKKFKLKINIFGFTNYVECEKFLKNKPNSIIFDCFVLDYFVSDDDFTGLNFYLKHEKELSGALIIFISACDIFSKIQESVKSPVFFEKKPFDINNFVKNYFK